MADSTQIFLILGLTLAAFAWGRFRYDLVALAALLATTLTGLVPASEAFLGFGHPAVITVAAVLVLSRGFERSGLVDVIAEQTLKVGEQLVWQVLVLTGTVLVLSAVMNNVGALALMLPVAMRMAREHARPPSLLLMPLAFGSLLGGLTTLIGTPPNIIISSYRAGQTGSAFGMFAFSPVGVGVALAGLGFIVLLGWRLTPRREGQASSDELFDTAHYLIEMRVEEDSKALGWSLRELQAALEEPVPVLAVVRDETRRAGHAFMGKLEVGDILLIEAGPDEMKLLEDKAGLRLGAEPNGDGNETDNEKSNETGDEGSEALKEEVLNEEASNKATSNKEASDSAVLAKSAAREDDGAEADEAQKQPRRLDSEGLQLVEAVVRNDSMMIHRTVVQLRLLNQHGLHLVAVARDGTRLKQRLRDIRFRAGDVLLLQGDEGGLGESLAILGCLPLASRNLTLGQPRLLALSLAIFALAIVAMLLDWLPAAVALSAAALVSLLAGVLPLREAYQAIDGPVIVLLGAMLPVGQALDTSGGAALIADQMLAMGRDWPVVATLAGLFGLSMLLSNVINNAAAALLMAPIAASLAKGFDASLDPFLMVVAVSASCAFLTPIGHQSNTLVMGPGGYRFSDYWKLGLPLSLVVILTAIPLILWIWPL
ncbi:MAG: SLC13 family permease [Onishia taeanensis]|uniref:SLC13 family permease n=1 Tax=Onishia taeanensis TaxID=284577 RepID=UPI003C7990F0